VAKITRAPQSLAVFAITRGWRRSYRLARSDDVVCAAEDHYGRRVVGEHIMAESLHHLRRRVAVDASVRVPVGANQRATGK